MEAGRELDAMVADKVMGLKWEESRCRICGWPKAMAHKVKNECIDGNCSQRPAPGRRADAPLTYSTDIAAAWLVVEKMRGKGMASVIGMGAIANQFTVWFHDGIWALGKYQNRVPDDGDRHLFGAATADTVPLAICLAALKAKDVEV